VHLNTRQVYLIPFRWNLRRAAMAIVVRMCQNRSTALKRWNKDVLPILRYSTHFETYLPCVRALMQQYEFAG